ncbi:hypothetical protein ACFFLZ_04160 [Photobacterium aphoticum]|uniref:Outer membrane protein beta-barrel domain-containing protein n=1 Tax=Photobacterium aphoticum TaxID=754436 RepID=A0A0J1GQF7_9GAMM|nr:hypothetical protein [Photobacterium aphoticum]KLV01649.1 hypothetical protein ABT58_04085 [Photobacterium aphoticum]PSU59219.1 hypothetical protein C9I90_03845 [Photobacterium aphoticum]GHA31070.1 hypothetical protein GCM10007086_00130 [Photobacterium aphoticum]
MTQKCDLPVVLAALLSPMVAQAVEIDRSGFSIAAGTTLLGGEMGGMVKDEYSGSTFSATFAFQYTTDSGVLFGGSYSPSAINASQAHFALAGDHIAVSNQHLDASLITLYSGYQFDSGWRLMAGAAQSDTDYVHGGYQYSKKAVDPMLGVGFQTQSGVNFDLFATQVPYAEVSATTLLIMMGTRI